MKLPDDRIITFVKSIQKHKEKNIVIVPHVNPDGDAIGASMALFHYFSTTNNCQVIAPSSFPDFLQWMPESDKVLDYKENKERCELILSKADLIIIADHNAPNRSGDLEISLANNSAPKLMIDHHPEPSYPVDYQISCTKVSSTAELVYNFINTINPEAFSIDIASAIYVGIMTDTGNFMHNVQPDTFKIVSQLIALEIDREQIYNRVFNNYSIDRMRLMGYTLSKKMEILEELETAILFLDKKELEEFNYEIGDTEGFVNMPLAIKGINISILIMERDGIVKMSFRSKGDIAINKIAKEYFNGGGHMNAAGGMEPDLSVSKTLVKLKEILRQNKSLLITNK